MASELSQVIREYKEIVKKLKTVEENFERYKLAFSSDFKDEIAKIEAEKIDTAKKASEATVKAQEPPTPPPKVEVNVRKVDKKTPNQKSMPAKVTQKQEQHKPQQQPHPEPQSRKQPQPELSSASAKPNDNIKVTKLYRKLCKLFHPDLCEDDNKFLQIQSCYEENNITDLIEFAVDNDVNVDEYIDNPKQLVEQWKNKINKIKTSLSNMTQMLPWVWCVASNDRKKTMRNNIIRNLQKGTGVKL